MSSRSRLKIIGEGSKTSYLLYECECGEIKEIYKYSVIAGKTKSCGCLLREKLVFGVGSYCDGKYVSQVKNKPTKEYGLWTVMLQRCYHPKRQVGHMCYVGCTASENFKNFQYFAEWCNQQTGFGKSGWCLDKDILLKGNKIYSEDTCCFVPNDINSLLVGQGRSGTRGAAFDNARNKYKASFQINGKTVNLGRFETKDEALKVYKVAKSKHIRFKADEYRGLIDEKVYLALMAYEVNE